MEFNLFNRTFYFFSNKMQVNKALDFLGQYFIKPEMLALLIILVVYFEFRFAAFVLKKEKLSDILRRISPWVYLVFILALTVFNRTAGERDFRIMPDAWLAGNGNYHESNILGALFNVAFYLPYGFLLYRWSGLKKQYISAISIVFVTSLLTEVLQYALARGVASVEDVVTNVIGGCIGAGAAAVWCRLVKK